ncbi:MAG: hypothetical protein PVI23_05720 [Maricaulaceae bacterium]|jgi:hypothetical protein
MATHDFDPSGICRTCGSSRSFAEKFGSRCETIEAAEARYRTRKAAEAAERAERERLWRQTIPLQNRLMVFLFAHVAAVALPLVGLFIMWLANQPTDALDRMIEETPHVGLHPAGLIGIVFIALSMLGVFMVAAPAWIAGGAFTLFGRFLSVIPLAAGLGYLWWLRELGALRFVASRADLPGSAVTLSIALAAIWALAGFWSLILDAGERLFGWQAGRAAEDVCYLLWPKLIFAKP